MIAIRNMPWRVASFWFELCSVTGLLRWRVSPSGKTHVGSVAGSVNKLGYRIVCLRGKRYRASRIVFALTHMRVPVGEIDHKDCNPGNDRPSNLRETGRSGNNRNVRVSKNNKLGVKGVIFYRGMYQATIFSNGRQCILGRFNSITAAKRAHTKAVKALHGEFGRVA